MLTVDKTRLMRMVLVVALIIGTPGARATAAPGATAATEPVCPNGFVPNGPEKELRCESPPSTT
jgi:hypothetical protein